MRLIVRNEVLETSDDYFQLTASGVHGNLVVSAPRPVEEDFKSSPGAVTVQPRPTVVQTVVEMTLNRESVTLRLVSKVKALVASLYHIS